ncbi:MAG: hypothetical protein AAF583_07555 [Pseudomonadota bacterium]
MSNPFEHLSDGAVSALLLDYVQHRLSDEDRAKVEIAAEDSSVLADELAYYQGLANAGELAAASPDHEFGWARLSKAIDQEPSATTSTFVAANDNARLWRFAAFSLGLIALVQTGFLLNSGYPSSNDQSLYVPVTEESVYAVQAIFSDSATAGDIDDLLIRIEGEITAGPSALGLYEIGFSSVEKRDAGLEALRETSELIESATPK